MCVCVRGWVGEWVAWVGIQFCQRRAACLLVQVFETFFGDSSRESPGAVAYLLYYEAQGGRSRETEGRGHKPRTQGLPALLLVL